MKWLRILLILMAALGGLFGMAPVAYGLIFLDTLNDGQIIMASVALSIYGYHVFAAYELKRNPLDVKHMLLSFSLQIPIIFSPIFVYKLSSILTFSLLAEFHPSWQVTLFTYFLAGGEWMVAGGGDRSWILGINLTPIACIIIVLLYQQWGANRYLPNKSKQADVLPHAPV